MYNIFILRRVSRAVSAMPRKQQEKLALLVDDIRMNCPSEQIGQITEYWQESVEVTYAGCRGSAPYAEH